MAVKPNEAPWVIFIRKKAVSFNSGSNEIFRDFSHCETLSVTFQNDVLKFQKAFRGIYHLSKLVSILAGSSGICGGIFVLTADLFQENQY